MRIDPAGWPFVFGGVALAAVAAFFGGKGFGLVLMALPVLCVFFFRDPERLVEAADSDVLSPADGRVLVAGAATAKGFLAADWNQVSIFLSPLDVHVNRIPVGGRITTVKHHPGRFLPAYRAEAGDLNEYTEVTLDHAGQTIVVRQIVGVLARRIVCRVKEDQVVKAGDRFGVMKFGSRMDVFLPKDATIQTRPGEKVVAGVTMLATLRGRPHA